VGLVACLWQALDATQHEYGVLLREVKQRDQIIDLLVAEVNAHIL